MLAFVFPGQGSENKGMGKELFDTVEEFSAAEAQINDILGYSIRELCMEDPNDQIHNTDYTQPALFLVNALSYLAKKAQGMRPDYLAGLSLGEYNALHAAGAFDLVTGIRLVQKRGALMAQARGGGMAAVVGLDVAKIQQILTDNNLNEFDIANYNSPVQTVISGPAAEIPKVKPLFDAAGVRLYKQLPASAAFHSRYMQEASRLFGEFLKDFEFNPLAIPVIANVTAEPYSNDSPTGSIRELLTRQICQSVKWLQSVQYLKQMGVTEFVEVGPGNVLTKLIKQI